MKYMSGTTIVESILIHGKANSRRQFERSTLTQGNCRHLMFEFLLAVWIFSLRRMEEGRREAGGEETGGEWDVAPAAHAVEDAAMEIHDQMQDEVLESATVVPAQSGTVTQENDASGGNITAYAMLPPPNSIPLDSILANTRVAPFIQAVRERLQDADVISKCEFLGSDSDPLFHTLEQDAEDWESYQEKLKQVIIQPSFKDEINKNQMRQHSNRSHQTGFDRE